MAPMKCPFISYEVGDGGGCILSSFPPNQTILGPEDNPFADYMWMENEEEFERQVEEEFWEEEFMEECFREMLEEEEKEWFIPARDLPKGTVGISGLVPATQHLNTQTSPQSSRLNPNAQEFIPSGSPFRSVVSVMEISSLC
uniref:polyadenylate-binding protein-interacting protein 2-like isoform X1 n=1 Tax=Myxine glutinosa TaxID=7769 RepID=UPI0035902400